VAQRFSKHNWIAGGEAGCAQAPHVLEKFALTGREDFFGGEHELHFFQEGGRQAGRNPVAAVGAVVDDSFQEDGKPGPGIALEAAKKVAHIFDARDVAEKFGGQKSIVLTRLDLWLSFSYTYASSD
jgi:hypothetical protein